MRLLLIAMGISAFLLCVMVVEVLWKGRKKNKNYYEEDYTSWTLPMPYTTSISITPGSAIPCNSISSVSNIPKSLAAAQAWTAANQMYNQYTPSVGTIPPPLGNNCTMSSAISGVGFNLPPYSSNQSSPQWRTNGPSFYPFDYYILSEVDKELVMDFKKRNPDFDIYHEEMRLILASFPNMRDSTIYLALLYDLSKKIRKTIKEYVMEEKNKDERTVSEL